MNCNECVRWRWLPSSVLVYATATVFSPGCANPDAHIDQAAPAPSPRHVYEHVYERVFSKFELAAFYKPREGTMHGLEADLAPLIVQEVTEHTADSVSLEQFGAVFVDEHGHVHVDVTQPTVYAAASTIALHGVERDQVVYIWWYPSGPQSQTDVTVQAQGIRMTLNAEGFPLVGEVLTSVDAWVPPVFRPGETIRDNESRPPFLKRWATHPQVLFVSSSLERAAADAFGPALPGRRYAIERSLANAPHTIVARVIEDGPMPMGPYVYLSADTHAVTTLLCRCSPSQMEQLVETAYYDLQPIESLGAWGFEVLANHGWWVSADGSNHPTKRATDTRFRLETALRWPGAK